MEIGNSSGSGILLPDRMERCAHSAPAAKFEISFPLQASRLIIISIVLVVILYDWNHLLFWPDASRDGAVPSLREEEHAQD
jgi:hypothetical protein